MTSRGERLQPLPIDAVIPQVIEAFLSTGKVVVDAAPGAGKTTRVPAALLSAVPADKKIYVLEPRRIAAKMAALRVADELGETAGETVGYAMRFEEREGKNTRLVFMTEGVLTRRLLRDPELRDVGAVVLDEVHERHLEGDLALALLLRLKNTARPDLGLVAMSATIEAARFAQHLGGAKVVRSEGRMFDVAIEHDERTDSRDLPLRIVAAVRRAVDEDPSGDVLVFLPGAAEIRDAMGALGPLARTAHLLVLPLHGSLSIEEQTRAIRPSDQRKVVVSTNVAESSLTIDGVTTVIDSGLANIASHSPWSGLPVLQKSPVCKASIVQRAGRAGRTQSGRAIRLFTKGSFEARPDFDAPEIMRADLAFVVLFLAGANVLDPKRLPFLDPPPAAALAAAEKLLLELGALRSDGGVTAIGKRMLDFPLHPRLGRVMVAAEGLGVGKDGAAMCALLSERDLGTTPLRSGGEKFASHHGGGTSDVLDALHRYVRETRSRGADSWDEERSEGFAHSSHSSSIHPARLAAVRRAERQISAIVRRGNGASENERDDRLRMALLLGYPDRVGRLRRPENETRRSEREVLFASGGSAALSPESSVSNVDLVIAIDAEERSVGGRTRTLVRIASAIESDWLLENLTDKIADKVEVYWNEPKERAEVARRLCYEELVLEETPARLEGEAKELASKELFRAASAKGTRAFIEGDALDDWMKRLRFARAHCPDAALQEIGDAEIARALQEACENIRSFAELRAVGLTSKVRGLLSHSEANKLNEIAPETWTLPGGRKAKVNYVDGAPPFIESRLQDFFGMKDGPAIALGRVKVVLHLLAPNYRAVQVTTDLKGFWERHYAAIARELRRKYPKHAWPDDPINAAPPVFGKLR